jgi:hypothetical protein
VLKAWRPVASSVRSRLRDWLLGGAHLLTDPSHMAPLQHAQVREGNGAGREEGERRCVIQGCLGGLGGPRVLCLMLCLTLYVCICK